MGGGGVSSLKLLIFPFKTVSGKIYENLRSFLNYFRGVTFSSLNRKPETTLTEFDNFFNRQKGNIIQKCTVIRYGFKELYVSKEVK